MQCVTADTEYIYMIFFYMAISPSPIWFLSNFKPRTRTIFTIYCVHAEFSVCVGLVLDVLISSSVEILFAFMNQISISVYCDSTSSGTLQWT